MSKTFVRCVVAAAAIVSAAPASRSQAQPLQGDIVTEFVVGEVSTTDDPFGGWIGVHVRLAPGWKIYWKAPGDAGVPPEFDWSASSNLALAEVQWPVPHRASILGIESVGYTGDVLFPVKVQLVDPDFDAGAELKLVLYACNTICVREERVLKADLSRPSGPDAQALIERWRDTVPAATSPSLQIASIAVVRSAPARIRVEATSARPLEHPDLFVASTPPAIYASRPEIEILGDRAVLTALLQGDPADLLRPLHITATLVDGDRAVEAGLASADAPAAATRIGGPGDGHATKDEAGSWWTVMVTPWLGGLILNLMPCVFPVLSLKLLGFVDDGAAARRTLRSGLVASAAGVIVSFLVLATALIALKAAGANIGWGIQFQHPVFLAVMAAVVALFAANLLGFFELSLPSGLMNALARRGMGSSVPSHFAGGFVATLLATPCSAPFVGTAVSFALSRGSLEIYAVFGALGIGMATPYLLAAAASPPRGGAAAARSLDALGQARTGRAAACDLGMAYHACRRHGGLRSRRARGRCAGRRPRGAVVAGGRAFAARRHCGVLRARAGGDRRRCRPRLRDRRHGRRSADNSCWRAFDELDGWCGPATRSSST